MAGRTPPPTRHNSAPAHQHYRRSAAGPLGACPPGRCVAAAIPCLRRTLPSAGAVNTFLSPRDGRENRQGAHTPPQGSPDTGRYWASQAAAQGSPRCSGATCPRAAAYTAGMAATSDLQPSTDSATNNISHVSIWPPASHRPAAEPTQPLSLPPQSLGGTCGGLLSVPATFPALTATWPIIPHTCCIYVHNRPSLP